MIQTLFLARDHREWFYANSEKRLFDDEKIFNYEVDLVLDELLKDWNKHYVLSLSTEPFEGANKLIFDVEEINGVSYKFGEGYILLCHSGLEECFKEIPKTIYFTIK